MTAQELFEKNKELYFKSPIKGMLSVLDSFDEECSTSLALLLRDSDEKWRKTMELFRKEFGECSMLDDELFLLRREKWGQIEINRILEYLRRMKP